MEFKSTLNLPDPEFTIAMKADLANREPEIQARWAEMGLYHRILESRANSPTFVLHDGPPYTNSPIHIGTALNKILKDLVVKSRTLMGYQCPYVPGYDNHGLPIEQTVMKAFHEQKLSPDVPTLRQACREHAAKYLDIQTQQFQRLGIFGLWEKPYTTMAFRYEAEIVRTFRRLVEIGQVYRGMRPVMWSPTSQTALADTEIIYKDVVSKAIYVAFPLQPEEQDKFPEFPNLHCVIWTTTPWTIPANLGVAFHPEYEYATVRAGDRHYLLLEALVEKTMAACGIADYEIVNRTPGAEFEFLRFKHPIFDRDSVGLLADYVTTEDGTGIVHTAPGHGREDFQTGKKYGLPVLCPVNGRGVLTEEAGEFAGVFYKDCDTVVLQRLREVGLLLAESDYAHSYPHAERDEKPVIFRTTDQWFVSIDANDLRPRLLDQIERVQWVPATGKTRITAMVANRPDWCVSRQRPWGVGIPIFYGAETGKPVMDPVAIEAVAQLIDREGSDAWFTRSAAEILPAGYMHPDTGETEFTKETDVFDVWFDSGATNLCVLEGNVEPEWPAIWPADIYFEGSDQHRGWFNVSLIIGTAIKGEAPFRAVGTHGFVNDEKGQKMSKRTGNVIDPVQVCNTNGADILRYWVASVDYVNDVPVSQAILKQCGDQYRTVRNQFRFLLGNLNGYDPLSPVEYQPIDQWIVEQTELLVADVMDAYEAYDFGRAITAIHNFCAKEISAIYNDAIKDRMYCDGADWPSRSAAQRACHTVIVALVKLIAPILPHTAEEVYERIPLAERQASVHMEVMPRPMAERLSEIEGNALQTQIAMALGVREQVFAEFERYKQEGAVKDSQKAICDLVCSEAEAHALTGLGAFLAIFFKMSEVNVTKGEFAVSFRPSPHAECARSRLLRPDCREVTYQGETVVLSKRDRMVLGVED
ncbi:MAG: isoleucine--tRNA ligase [Chthonomonas sp.]|nr:isoleucine--tRNA ligase [Chthonomonas sp.]